MQRLMENTQNFLYTVMNAMSDGDWLNFGVKSEKNKKMYTKNIRKTNLSSFVEKEARMDKSHHIYICPQAFKHGARIEENLFSLHYIVLDIDCHSHQVSRNLRDLRLQKLAYLLMHDASSEYNLPLPTYIIYTGRGLQVWWSHEPMAANKCLWTWKSVIRCFIETVNRIINDYSGSNFDCTESLEGLYVDAEASMNPVGFFRLPGTYNPSARAFSDWDNNSLETVTYSYWDLRNYRDEYRKQFPLVKKKSQRRFQVPGTNWCQTCWAESMACKVENLRNLRDADCGDESRNNYSLILYCLYRAAGMTEEEAFERLSAFNKGFKKPMTRREMKSTLTSARKKLYKFSEKSIVKILDITPEEAKRIGLSEKKVPTDNQMPVDNDRALALVRQKSVIEMYLETDDTQEEVAKKLGLSRKRVGEILRNAGITRAAKRREKILSLHRKGKSIDEICAEVNCSDRTVYRALENTSDAEGAPKAAQNTTQTTPSNQPKEMTDTTAKDSNQDDFIKEFCEINSNENLWEEYVQALSTDKMSPAPYNNGCLVGYAAPTGKTDGCPAEPAGLNDEEFEALLGAALLSTGGGAYGGRSGG